VKECCWIKIIVKHNKIKYSNIDLLVNQDDEDNLIIKEKNVNTKKN
jgi:DNA-binding sugar fermentation-stimulating protein